LAQNLVADRRARLDDARARTVRAWVGQHSFEALLDAFAGHDDQTEIRYRHGFGRRTILLELLFDRLQHALPILTFLHVDEIEHDDAAKIAQANLPDDLLHSLQVGLHDRVFESSSRLLADIAPSVDVDGDERLGLIDHDRAARLQPDLALQRFVDLSL